MKVELISTAGGIHFPARDNKGTCFYVKLVNHVAYEHSWYNSVTDKQVVSRDHNDQNQNWNIVRHPYVLGAAKLIVQMDAPRSMILAGAPNDAANIQVDNFVMIGLAPMAKAGDPAYYKAYGTSDSTAWGSQNVWLNSQPVPLAPFGKSGTSTVAPLGIDGLMNLKTPYALDVRALDAGGVGVSSDIYLIVN